MKSCLFPGLLMLSVSLFLTGSCKNKSPDPAFLAVDSLIRQEISLDNIPGAVILVSKDNRLVYNSAYGYAQKYDFGKIPLARPLDMQENTLFDLASLTKVFATTYAVMLLVDKGRVGLDDPVVQHLPAFSAADKAKITIRQLLTHSSGLSEWKPVYYHAGSRKQALQYINALPRAYPLAETRHYSDLGFMTLGYLVEEVSGQTLNDFLQENLYHKLGLSSTTFLPRKEDYPSIAATSHGNPFEQRMVADDSFGYLCDEDPDDFKAWRHYTLTGEVNDGNAFHANGGIAGHAGLFSTAQELNVLITLLLNRGWHNDTAVIKEETISAFLSKDAFDNGLGWAMSEKIILTGDFPDISAFGHTGFTGTYVLGVPELKLALVLLTNRQNCGVNEKGYYYDLNHLRRQVVNIVLKKYLQTR